MGPFIFLAGMVLGVLVTLLAAALADRLSSTESSERHLTPATRDDQTEQPS